MKAEIILRVKNMPILTRKDICFMEKLLVKIYSSFTLSIEKAFFSKSKYLTLKNDRDRQKTFLAHPGGGKERPIYELCVHYLPNSGRSLSFLFHPSSFLGHSGVVKNLWQRW